jgi:putative FmdB family regulatory protein
MKRKDHAITFLWFDFPGLRVYYFLGIIEYPYFGSNSMPIFEFRCMECNHIFEKLFANTDEKVEMACPECQSGMFERVVSRSNYVMGVGPGGKKGKITSKSCGPTNKCMTLDLPGPGD